MFAALQLLAILLFALAGVFLGRSLGRRNDRLWFAGFLLPLAAITLVILGHRCVTLSFAAPISWAIHPYVAPLLMALAIPLMLTTLLVRLPARRTRITVAILTTAMLANYSLLPITLPLLVETSLAASPTKLTRDHICLQTHPYTCGPAAAVTCLAFLHIHAEEGALAIDSHCAPALGADPILLAAAINRLTLPHNIRCDYRLCKSLDALPTPAIADIFSPQYGGHYVAVLAIDKTTVAVGDPFNGESQWPRAEFLREWTGAAHCFTPQTPSSQGMGHPAPQNHRTPTPQITWRQALNSIQFPLWQRQGRRPPYSAATL